MKKRLPLLIVLGGGLLLWKTGAFGFFPTERTLIWRLPVSYGDVRRLELQVWEGDALVKREEQTYAAGLTFEPTFKVPLASGTHRAIATVGLASEPAARGFQLEFNPGSDESIVLELKSSSATR